MRNLERHWYRPSHDLVTGSLLPLSWVFRSAVKFRRFLYKTKLKKSYDFSVPVIVVGNITVGGTGKTPFVIWLAKYLKRNGYKPGIVSRGVGGKQKCAPRWVEKNSNPKAVGDEAILLASRSECPVVIGVNRVAAVQELLSNSDCDIVISDDGLQHYRMDRDIEIAILDGERGLGNQSLLPAGPLRESPSRLKEVDFVVQQAACCSNIPADFMMRLRGDLLVAIKDDELKIPLNHFQNETVHAVAAIGNPKRFFDFLRREGMTVIEHSFPDHYLYEPKDFNFGDDLPILMTEKDAVKCQKFADERFWYLPVEMEINEGFAKTLLERIKGVKKERLVA